MALYKQMFLLQNSDLHIQQLVNIFNWMSDGHPKFHVLSSIPLSHHPNMSLNFLGSHYIIHLYSVSGDGSIVHPLFQAGHLEDSLFFTPVSN